MFIGYTIFKSVGIWKGYHERSLIIEIVHSGRFYEIEQVANYIKKLNKQESILIVSLDVNSKFI
jgi:hypothetical protein